MNNDLDILFTPCKIGNCEIKNRILRIRCVRLLMWIKEESLQILLVVLPETSRVEPSTIRMQEKETIIPYTT